jgi:hypothetical protein
MRFLEINQYIADFEELIRRAGYTIGSKESISFFLNGLTPSILDAVITHPFPTTYVEYKNKAIQQTKARQMVEAIRARRGIPTNRPQNTFNQPRNNFQPRNWPQRGPSQNSNTPGPWRQQAYNSTTAPRPSYNNVQVLMDLSRTRAPNNRRFPRANQMSTNGQAAQVLGDPPKKPLGPCFHCGRMGHLIKDCRSRQSSSAYVHNAYQHHPAPSIHPDDSISYMDTNEDDMRSVAPPTLAPQTTVASLKAQIDSLSPAENDSLIEMMGATQDFTPA